MMRLPLFFIGALSAGVAVALWFVQGETIHFWCVIAFSALAIWLGCQKPTDDSIGNAQRWADDLFDRFFGDD